MHTTRTARTHHAAAMRADRTADLRAAYADRRTEAAPAPVRIAWGTRPATMAECRDMRVAACIGIARASIAEREARQLRTRPGIFAAVATLLGVRHGL